MPFNRALERHVPLVYERFDIFCDLRQIPLEYRDRAAGNFGIARGATERHANG